MLVKMLYLHGYNSPKQITVVDILDGEDGVLELVTSEPDDDIYLATNVGYDHSLKSYVATLPENF